MYGKSETEADKIIRELEEEQANRGTFDDLFAQVARRVMPTHDTFQGKNKQPGRKRTEWQFDSLAQVANQRFGAAFKSMSIPDSERYHGLQPEARHLRKNDETKRYCEEATDALFAMRYNSRSSYSAQTNELFECLGTLGTAIMMIDDPAGRSVNYKACPLSHSWMREGADGKINRMYRKLEYNADRAVEEFGEAKLPQKILEARDKASTQKFDFYHRVMPNPHIQRDIWGWPGMAYVSDYVSKEGRVHLTRKGFHTFPFAVARYVTGVGEVYGRSPAMLALADIKMRNEIKRTVLRAAHRMAEPILLLGDDANLQPFQMQPGFRNKGYVKGDGTAMAQQLKWEGDLAPAIQMLDETGRVINDIFLVYLFQILIETPTMTATEVLERTREKGILLTPTVGRFQSEFLGSQIERELDIASARNLLPEMPQILRDAGGLIEITYDSPLTRAQKAEQALGFVRTLETILPFAEQDPTILQRFKLDTILPELAQINGMPLDWMETDDDWKKILMQIQQAKNAEQAAAMAQPLATAAKDAAQARVLSQQAA
jgi:hypothetical protein